MNATSGIKIASRMAGVGMSVPPRVVANDYFASYLETTDEWIKERTGIEERRWASPEVSASELAEPACRDAIAQAGLSPGDIDGVICATVTPDNVFPSTACYIQNRLGVSKGFAFDVNAVCSGFVYALTVADSMMRSGMANNVLVIGVDLYSRIINPNDRSTCVLFGDGAGAVVLSRVSENTSQVGEQVSDGVLVDPRADSGIYSSEIRADGSHTNILCVPSGTASPVTPESLGNGQHYLTMAGREVFKLAVRSLVEITENILDKSCFSADDVSWFISHQANQRILQAMAKQLKVPEERVLSNVDKYGNTSAASIPILLAESVLSGAVKKGDLLLLNSFGGGATWGAILARW